MFKLFQTAANDSGLKPYAIETKTDIILELDAPLEIMLRGTRSRPYHSKKFTAKFTTQKPTLPKVAQHRATQKTRE